MKHLKMENGDFQVVASPRGKDFCISEDDKVGMFQRWESQVKIPKGSYLLEPQLGSLWREWMRKSTSLQELGEKIQETLGQDAQLLKVEFLTASREENRVMKFVYRLQLTNGESVMWDFSL